eukprot:s2066_g11.t1
MRRWSQYFLLIALPRAAVAVPDEQDLAACRAFEAEEQGCSEEALFALQQRARKRSGRFTLDYHLQKTVTLTGIHNGFFDDVINSIRDAYEHVKDCLDESLLMRFAMWIRFVVDTDRCNYEASVNSGSAHLTVSACGHMPLTGSLFRGPGVQYDNNGFTLSSCALGVACADLRFENKAADCQFDVWDIKVKARTENFADISTTWVTVLSNVTLHE